MLPHHIQVLKPGLLQPVQVVCEGLGMVFLVVAGQPDSFHFFGAVIL
jgi:hypothetical protein